jgi:hypothetical protein
MAAYFRRSYAAVDGLWFMKVEERLGFDEALELDARVWEVLPKIQARMLKELLGLDSGLSALAECLSTRLEWEGQVFERTLSPDGRHLRIEIRECPWQALMVKSGRGHLAARVGQRICTQEYAVLAAEFGPGIEFTLEGLACAGDPACVLSFVQHDAPEGRSAPESACDEGA